MSKFFGEGASSHAREVYEHVETMLDPSKLVNLTLGTFTTHALLDDPKRFGFMMARHKFVGKMLTDFDRVLEVGCQEGFTSLLMSQHVKNLVSVDFFKEHIREAQQFIGPYAKNVEFRGHDILDGPVQGTFDGAFSLDVLEHIDARDEDTYMKNVTSSLKPEGVFIVGMPSLESQKYASPGAAEGHINCKTGADLKLLCRKYFNHVFMFSMNDEVLHTGFMPMSHYIFAMCVTKKSDV
jgi:2-polyprenyl-3-methyl-5-hydroxy-6-metoxy-1,4-benzoquinol methylase